MSHKPPKQEKNPALRSAKEKKVARLLKRQAAVAIPLARP